MTDEQAVRAGISELARAFSDGDVDAVMGVFGPDPVTFPPNEPRRQGREAVRDWQATILGQFTGSAQLDAWDVEIHGDVAIASGTYTMDMTAEDGTRVGDRGKFVQTWQRESSGEWKLTRNIWNSSAPPAVDA